MLNDAIATVTAESPREYRERQAEWWEQEARACDALGLDDLVVTCLVNAQTWRDWRVVQWGTEP